MIGLSSFEGLETVGGLDGWILTAKITKVYAKVAKGFCSKSFSSQRDAKKVGGLDCEG
jgi:hypothetical protein